MELTGRRRWSHQFSRRHQFRRLVNCISVLETTITCWCPRATFKWNCNRCWTLNNNLHLIGEWINQVKCAHVAIFAAKSIAAICISFYVIISKSRLHTLHIASSKRKSSALIESQLSAVEADMWPVDVGKSCCFVAESGARGWTNYYYYLSHTTSASHMKHPMENFPISDNGTGCLKRTFGRSAMEIFRSCDKKCFKRRFLTDGIIEAAIIICCLFITEI